MSRIASILTLALLICLGNACTRGDGRDKAKQDLLETEKAFEKMAADKGVAEAFAFYADENATVEARGDVLIKGRENIRAYYSQPNLANATVTWTAEFADAATSGDLGYTYGHYVWQSQDSTGLILEKTGIFHTVWKKQADGTWKYVWD